ncbi:MAG: hypothetical protein AB1Y22_06675 [Cycloclasticus sp.]
MQLPDWLYETMPFIYFTLGFASAQIDYGQLSSAMFFAITLYVHVSRYSNRQRINKARKYGQTKATPI